MMYRYARNPDIFTSSDQAIVNPVNCVGVAGKGLALEFRRRYPNMFKRYRTDCQQRVYQLGQPRIDRRQMPWIVNFPTKHHWRDNSDIYAIRDGLKTLATLCEKYAVSSLSVPALGCGEGRLPWHRVRGVLEQFGNNVSFLVTIYPPRSDDFEDDGQ